MIARTKRNRMQRLPMMTKIDTAIGDVEFVDFAPDEGCWRTNARRKDLDEVGVRYRFPMPNGGLKCWKYYLCECCVVRCVDATPKFNIHNTPLPR